jgi:hypothetical protein
MCPAGIGAAGDDAEIGTRLLERLRIDVGFGALVLPPVPNRSRPRVSGRVRGKFAVEFSEQRHAVGKPKLRTGGSERGIFRQRRAVDDEACPFHRLARHFSH